MKWNWPQPDWPRFSWSSTRLAKAEERFLLGAGVFKGSVRHLDDGSRERLTIEALSGEATSTSEIEGELLDRDSVQSSIRRELGLTLDGRRASPAEQGVSKMMVELYRSFEEPPGKAKVCSWHAMLMKGRRDLRDIGCYRPHAGPMQIVSGRTHEPKVYFEAPSSSTMPAEMIRFFEWCNRSARSGSELLPALLRAGIALEGQQRTHARIEFLIDKTKLLDRLRGRLNDRQQTVLLRVLREGPEGFEGGLSAGNYVRIANTSPATARRDLGGLVEQGALERTGERRHARYHLTIPLRPVSRVTIDETGNILIANQEPEADDS